MIAQIGSLSSPLAVGARALDFELADHLGFCVIRIECAFLSARRTRQLFEYRNKLAGRSLVAVFELGQLEQTIVANGGATTTGAPARRGGQLSTADACEMSKVGDRLGFFVGGKMVNIKARKKGFEPHIELPFLRCRCRHSGCFGARVCVLE